MEDHIGACVKERLDRISFVGQLFTYIRGFHGKGRRNLGHPERRHSRDGAGFRHPANILFRHKVQVRQHVVLLPVSGNLYRVLYAAQHEVRGATAFGVAMDGKPFLVGLHDELHHLVVTVETFHAMIARLVGVILVLPAGMRLRNTIQEAFDAHYVQIVAVIFGAQLSCTGNLRLRVFHVVGR